MVAVRGTRRARPCDSRRRAGETVRIENATLRECGVSPERRAAENCQLTCSCGAPASIIQCLAATAHYDREAAAQLLDVEVDELRDYLASNIRTSSTRRTGFRFVRGTHCGHYVRDREGTDTRPAGVAIR